MWEPGWRDHLWSKLSEYWDIIIIGGGITGAGIYKEAVQRGLKTLLVEAHDFASGTSSRSSKLVHGGFRYLKNGQLLLTIESVKERENLLHQARGLVNPLGCLIANYQYDKVPSWVFGLGLALYDMIALNWEHRHYDEKDLPELCPSIGRDHLKGGYRFFDAQTDDARLVFRLIDEATDEGGSAINYAGVSSLLKTQDGSICGILLTDHSPGGNLRTQEIQSRLVINATGAWSDEVRSFLGEKSKLRKLRGSHLIFPNERLNLTRMISVMHPRDGRPVFAFPWEGVTLVGTTDIDQGASLPKEPLISPDEVEYLMDFVRTTFPERELTLQDIQSVYSGIRPVIDTGKSDPSKESREHVLWLEKGLLTVTGGKLTTFRIMARDVLKTAAAQLPELGKKISQRLNASPILKQIPVSEPGLQSLKPGYRMRFLGRYGQNLSKILRNPGSNDLELIPGTPYLWVELSWAAQFEAVIHLEDLLLRRIRLGLIAPQGGLNLLEEIRKVAQPLLGWTNDRWNHEVHLYKTLWKQYYSLG